MNIFSILGFILAIGVLTGGLLLATDDLRVFWDLPSVFIVIGGTLASTAIAFQLDKIANLFKTFFKIIFQKSISKYSTVIIDLIKIGDAYRKGTPLEQLANKASDPFMKEGLIMVADGILPPEQILKILEDRANNQDVDRREEANKLKVIGKFAPAFGMMGTTIGMIVLLANLGGADAVKKVGPAMAVCLITTFYGVVLAYLAFLPVAENLTNHSKTELLKDSIIIEGIRLIMKKENPVILAEELNSFLKPNERVNWKEIVSRG
jgi:chemotaxis protein MotA